MLSKRLIAIGVSAAIAASSANAGFEPIQLGKLCNKTLIDDTPEGDGKGGWTDQGKDNSLTGFPTGSVELKGIPFKIPANGPAAVVFDGKKLSATFKDLPGELKIDTPSLSPHQALYLLAVGVWNCPKDAKAADVTITFDGGSKQSAALSYGNHLSGWWGPQEVAKGVIAWKGKNGRGAEIGVYLVPIALTTADKGIRSIAIKADKPAADKPDGGSLVILGVTAGDKKAADILPAKLTWKAWDGNGVDGWFPIECKYDEANVPAPWEDAFDFFKTPAGSLGWTVANGENLEFEKAPGVPVRFKGLTTCGPGFHPSLALAKRYASVLRKYGFNQVRFHSLFDTLLKQEGEFCLPELNPSRMEKFDKLFFELKQAGIYTKLSGHFSCRWARSTGVEATEKLPSLHNAYYTFDEKHQELYLTAFKLFLEHVNPHTKLRYVDDPAFNMYKVVNESSLFFNSFETLPGFYAVKLQDRYNEWLKKKYGTDGKLLQAWRVEGEANPFNVGTESLGGGTVALLGVSDLSSCSAKHRKRATDQTRFYYELESSWFEKVRDTVRALGGKTLVQGSSWGGPGHLQEIQTALNTRLDFVGKHTYWLHPHGGWTAAAALFSNEPIFTHPLDHMLTCAYQHVAGKPFAITEWNFCYPNDYTVEAAPFMAAYGAMQNINANHRFVMGAPELASSKSGFFDMFASPGGMGVEPLSYFLYVRGDVKPAPVIYENCLSDDLLHNPDRKKGQKKNTSENRFYMKFDPQAVPDDAMLVGGVRLSFDEKKFPPVWDEKAYASHHDKAAKTLTSVTGELVWDYGRGNTLVKTPKSRAVMGFLDGVNYKHEGLSFTLGKAYGVVSFCSIDNKPLEESSRILLTLVGRDRNSNQELERLMQGDEPVKSAECFRVGKIGGSPLIMEPVEIDFALKTAKSGPWSVTPLDAAGRPMNDKKSELAVAGGALKGKLSNKTTGAFNFIIAVP